MNAGIETPVDLPAFYFRVDVPGDCLSAGPRKCEESDGGTQHAFFLLARKVLYPTELRELMTKC